MMFIQSLSPVLLVVIRNPNWGDSQLVDVNKIIRKTRAGHVLHTHPAQWGTIRIHTWSFSVLTAAKMAEFKAFVSAVQGGVVNVTKASGWARTGHIISPVVEVVTDREPCSYSLSFDFQETVLW